MKSCFEDKPHGYVEKILAAVRTMAVWTRPEGGGCYLGRETKARQFRLGFIGTVNLCPLRVYTELKQH